VAAEAPEARGDVRLAQLWNLLEYVIQEVAVAAVEQGFLCNRENRTWFFYKIPLLI
jgi:hypothetical protein